MSNPKPTSTPHTPEIKFSCPHDGLLFDDVTGKCPKCGATIKDFGTVNQSTLSCEISFNQQVRDSRIANDAPHTAPLEWMREAAKEIVEKYGDEVFDVDESANFAASIIARHSPGWVKIEEGKPETLPEEDDDILIAVRYEMANGCSDEPHIYEEVYRGRIYSTDKQLIATCDNGDEFEGKEVVAWSRLPIFPAPPSEGDRK